MSTAAAGSDLHPQRLCPRIGKPPEGTAGWEEELMAPTGTRAGGTRTRLRKGAPYMPFYKLPRECPLLFVGRTVSHGHH